MEANGVTQLLIKLIRIYQRWVSPMTAPHCRFQPSCSAYAVEALESHGLVRGSVLSLWRLLRCNPWGGSGYDPVPSLLAEKKPAV